MSITLSTAALKNIERTLAEDASAANPFIYEGDALYLRFDAIQILGLSEHAPLVVFLWQGKETHRMAGPHADLLVPGAMLALEGLEGQMRIRLR